MAYKQGQTESVEIEGMTFHILQTSRPRYEYLKRIANFDMDPKNPSMQNTVDFMEADTALMVAAVKSVDGYQDSSGKAIKALDEEAAFELAKGIRDRLLAAIRGDVDAEDEAAAGNAESADSSEPKPE